MAYLNFQNCTKKEYETTLYSQDAHNKIKILFNNIELQDADKYCEKFIVKSRILPNGSKVFGLNNFVAKEAELILHDIDTSIIQDKISISIGTLVNNTYEYVPIGIFNIQDTPTNDKNKTTIKLRDNAEKFDFNYNAKPIIDANNGSATKMQILEDICIKAEVTCAVDSFLGDSDLIGIYDNTITARQYVAYLAESAGCIATINREGELIFIHINNLAIWKIPLNIVEKYELAKSYTIGRVVFEDGIVRFETPQNEYDTLYLDASNPYIVNQRQVENIFNLVNNFNIDSFKTGNILGNPAIDGYDIIEIYGYYELLPNGNKRFIDDEETIVAKTLATTELKYSGVLTNSFDTEIGEAERTNNITIVGEPTFKKWVKTEINNVEGTLTTTVGEVSEQNKKISQITQSVNEINSKISDISDITTSGETSYATLNLVDVNESYPISIKIRPIDENISYLYPYNGLYPSSTTYLKSRTLRFTNTTIYQETEDNKYTNYKKYYSNDGDTYTLLIVGTDYNVGDIITGTIYENTYYDWVLPTNLWYYSETIYDEIELSYGDGTNPIVIATRRCQINADSTISVLDTPTTETYPYPTNFVLTTGDYTITLLGYNNAYLYVQLMASNIYTTQFYTKAETESRISQTIDEIELDVSQTLSGYSTTSEMNAAINLKADEINSVVSRKVGKNEIISKINQSSEQISINANKVNLQGYVTINDLSSENSTTINGSNITTGNIKSNNYVSGTSGTLINLVDGSIDTKGFKVSSNGNLTATTGNIAGWQILSDRLRKTVGNYNIEVLASSQNDGATFLVWDNANDRYNWYVNANGKMYARNCEISGNVNATSGSFSGSIYSSSGKIGGWNISGSRLYGTTSGERWAIRPYGLDNDDMAVSFPWSSLINSSDERMKTDIKDIEEKFELFYNNLKPKTFYFKEGFFDDKKHIGFIAQDILKNQEQINEDLSMVALRGKYYSLERDEIVALNTWQIQKLKKQVQEQQETINNLIQRIEKLEKESDK